MNGKSKCKILKDIRKQIAQENDIEWIVSECSHKGDCAGTCPKCEAEVRQLERELDIRRKLGKVVALAGISAASLAVMTGCGLDKATSGSIPYVASETEEMLAGDVIYEPETDEEVDGNMGYIEETEVMLDGDVYYEPESGQLPEDACEPITSIKKGN